MPVPPAAPQSPPEFHPEFGYFWPAPQFRRVLRVAFISTLCGAAMGALAVFAALSAHNARQVDAAAVAPAALATVGRATPAAESAASASAPTSDSSETCSRQTWPYLDGDCLAKSEQTDAGAKDVRVLRPDQPAQSAPAVVIAAPSGREAAKAEAEAAEAKAAAAAKESAKKERRHRHARRARQSPDPDNYQTYADPYRERYEPRRAWGWQW